MTPAAPCLELRAVGHRYPGAAEPSLAGLDLAVEEGETLALVGESGSGKTTVLRLVDRLLEPSAGEIRFRGAPLTGADPVAHRRRVGYVPQEGGLLPHWTVRRNVELVPRLLGWPAARRRERAEEMLALVGLDPAEHGKRYPLALSGGQRQRVALARALAAEPDLVLLDEPFGALDALTRRRLQGELLALSRRLRPTQLLVTHDLAEALLLGDRIAVLRRGRLLQVAPPADLRARPADPYVAELLALLAGEDEQA